jgi:hypothetical protein
VLRWTRDGKTTERGLGAADGAGKVSLALARQLRDQAMEQIANGLDPRAERRKAKDARQNRKTFAEVAALVIAARKSGWRTSHEGRNASLTDWTMSLTVACAPIAKKYVDEVTVEDIKRVVSPFWDEEKHTTARRLLNRIDLTIEYALAHGVEKRGQSRQLETVSAHRAARSERRRREASSCGHVARYAGLHAAAARGRKHDRAGAGVCNPDRDAVGRDARRKMERGQFRDRDLDGAGKAE